MATPRKKHFRVGDSILREPWTRDQKLDLVLLQAHLNTRWRRDGIPNDRAGHCILSRGDLQNITGKTWVKSGQNSLRTLTELVSMSVKPLGELTEVDWPKFAEYQIFTTRKQGSKQARNEPSEKAPRTPYSVLRTPEGQEPLPSGEPPARSRLLNLLSKEPGGDDEKAAWLEHEQPLIEAEAESGNGTQKTLTIRYYRQYAKTPEGERKYFDFAAKERTRARIVDLEARDAARDPPANVDFVPPELARMFE